jgi:hypothetical protein
MSVWTKTANPAGDPPEQAGDHPKKNDTTRPAMLDLFQLRISSSLFICVKIGLDLFSWADALGKLPKLVEKRTLCAA